MPEKHSVVHPPLAALRGLGDIELAALLANGCNDALAVLFERHHALAFRVALGIVKDFGEAEEAVQLIFLKIFRKIHQFDPQRGTFIVWLNQFVYHTSMDRLAHLRASRVYDSVKLDEINISQASCPLESVCLVKEILPLIKPSQRRVVELTYFEGLTAEEISKQTGETPSSVRHNLYRGLAELRNLLRGKKRSERKTFLQFAKQPL